MTKRLEVGDGAAGELMICYCPKCGAQMNASFVDGALRSATCEQGCMELSPRAAAEIGHEFFGDDGVRRPEEMRFTLGRRWYCPRDGVELQAEGRHEPSCPVCGRVLRSRTIRQLVEYHPHK